eukprot:Colp12_sorted_trinity150504_noHs@28215
MKNFGLSLATLVLCIALGASAPVSERSAVQTWGLMLNNWNQGALDSVHASSVNWAVLAPEPWKGRFATPAEVSYLRGNGKNLLAYISVGEAAQQFSYWASSWSMHAPSFMGAASDWSGAVKVQYWDPSWQQIIFSYIDTIMAAGWDGLYLDRIDTYQYYSDAGTLSVTDAANRMVDFVTQVAARARSRRAGAFIFPQNGLAILDHASPAKASQYLSVINGVGAETTFFVNGVLNPYTYNVQLMDRFRAAGKAVLSLDYVSSDQIGQYASLCRQHGYLPFTTDKMLTQWQIINY